MGWRQLVTNYLSFTRKDRIAILVLVAVICGVFFLPGLLPRAGDQNPPEADTAWVTALKKMEQKSDAEQDPANKDDDDNSSAYQFDRTAGNYPHKPKGDLFYFDPNILPAPEWKRLGLREKTIRTIQNYLSKGGRFRQPEDLKKIYGLFPDEYERIAPYIRIADPNPGALNRLPGNDRPGEQPGKPYEPKYSVTDINSADTTALIALPGIGSRLAARIILFRDKLGGFYSIQQVSETYGLPDSAFQKIKPYLKLENVSLRKININAATLDELKMHPYIRYAVAGAIIAYRKEHGHFSGVEDLKKIMAVSEDLYQKISPYLTVQ